MSVCLEIYGECLSVCKVCGECQSIWKPSYECRCVCMREIYNLFHFFVSQCAQRSNARTANMEWSTKPTTMDVKSASANLTVSKSLSANRIVSVCKPDGESQCVCKPDGESQCVCKPYGESLSAKRVYLSATLR